MTTAEFPYTCTFSSSALDDSNLTSPDFSAASISALVCTWLSALVETKVSARIAPMAARSPLTLATSHVSSRAFNTASSLPPFFCCATAPASRSSSPAATYAIFDIGASIAPARSVGQPQAQLDLPHRRCCRDDPKGRRAAGVRARRRQVHHVERVRRF